MTQFTQAHRALLMRHLEDFAPADDAKRHQETSGKDGAKNAIEELSLDCIYLQGQGEHQHQLIRHRYTERYLLQETRMVLHSIRVPKHPPCMFLWILLTNHPHVSLQACSTVVQRAAIWRQVYRLTILLEVSQPGSARRKTRPSVSMLFSWITSSAA